MITFSRVQKNMQSTKEAQGANMQIVNRLLGILAIGFLVCVTPSVAQERGGQINLIVGEVHTIPMPADKKIVRIGIGNGKLFSGRVLEKESKMILIPENPGRTNLVVWTADGGSKEYAVNVLAANIDETVVSINAMLKGINGVKAERAGDSVLMSGSTTKINMPRVQAISKAFPLVINAIRDEDVEMKRMVYMRVQIVEMKKSLVENLGVQWGISMPGPSAGIISGTLGGSNFRPGSIPAGLPTTIPIAGYPGVQPIVGLTTIINSTLNLAVNSGDAFVLATPELSTRSGGKAEFLAGGQVPIVSPASGTTPATVSFKDYGIKLTIEPRADESNNVSTSLNTEISSIDNSVAVAGNPGFLTRKTSSEFNVQAGQTIVISGLVNSDLSKDVSKLAGLGDIPVLGALFRSTNFRSGRTDLVILVTPMIIDPSEGGVKKASDIQERANGFAQEKGLLLK